MSVVAPALSSQKNLDAIKTSLIQDIVRRSDKDVYAKYWDMKSPAAITEHFASMIDVIPQESVEQLVNDETRLAELERSTGIIIGGDGKGNTQEWI